MVQRYSVYSLLLVQKYKHWLERPLPAAEKIEEETLTCFTSTKVDLIQQNKSTNTDSKDLLQRESKRKSTRSLASTLFKSPPHPGRLLPPLISLPTAPYYLSSERTASSYLSPYCSLLAPRLIEKSAPPRSPTAPSYLSWGACVWYIRRIGAYAVRGSFFYAPQRQELEALEQARCQRLRPSARCQRLRPSAAGVVINPSTYWINPCIGSRYIF